MTAKPPALPPVWYQTLRETAAEFGTHVDRILYYLDAGMIVPAALIPKALLPGVYPGPSPYLVVRLDEYREMAWLPDGNDMVAALAGNPRTYQIDGDAYVYVELDGSGIVIRRSELVIPCDQVEALHEQCEVSRAARGVHPAKLRTLQRLLGLLILDRWGEAGTYTIAESIVRASQLTGISISKECAAGHVKECRAELELAKASTEGDEAVINVKQAA